MAARPMQAGPMRPADRKAVAESLEAAGILSLADRDFTTLSGGEKQRVHLARALAQIWPFRGRGEAKFLLLDEPTNNLDLSHQHRLLGFARDLAEAGLAVAAVLHDPNLASAYAHRVAIMKAGRLTTLGTPAEVMTAGTVSEIYGLGLQPFGQLRTGAHLLFAEGA
ncbi:MAG: ATP-binding cassette domain-containing protein [Minwuia sp.]|uniref:ATP-binding cassette domain-containing protein n=1 Tax=Minwuia sp. TaxID=2493630 RepID=UPI003A8C7665